MNQTDNIKNVSNSKENNLQADVVIVGTGVGGCFSALNLSEDLSIIMITKSGEKREVVGSSIGGGSIKITEVNGNKVEFTGDYPTLIIAQKDVPGVVSKVTNLLYEKGINIAFMSVFRRQRGQGANMVFELDHGIDNDTLSKIREVDYITRVIMVNPVKEGEE